MNVILNTYPVAFQCPGGGEIQLVKSIEALASMGVNPLKFDPWTTNLTAADVVHYFSVQGGSMSFCGYVHDQNIPLVISPILWLSENPEIYPLAEISRLLNIADIICPNSEAEARQLSTYFDIPHNKFVVTHNGIDEIFTQRIDEELFRSRFSINEAFALCVGNIEPRKNQLLLVEAIQNIDIKLVLIGNIRDDEYFERCSSADVNEKVSYIGHINHHDPLLRSAYSACEVFVLPSLLETPGLAALEAAASGAKLVITQIGATHEYFGDYAYYISPDNVDDLSEKLSKALSEENTESTFDASKYMWRRTAEELTNAYELAIEKHAK